MPKSAVIEQPAMKAEHDARVMAASAVNVAIYLADQAHAGTAVDLLLMAKRELQGK